MQDKQFQTLQLKSSRSSLVQFSGRYSLEKKIVGVYDDEGPPVPIPNTEVKLVRANNTWLETAREDRSTPTLKKNLTKSRQVFSLCLAGG